MTSKQVMDQFFARSVFDRYELRLFTRALLHHLADHWYELRLIDGQQMNDATDAAMGLRELAEAARLPQNLADRTCPKCYHVHEKDSECGVNLGKGGVCECKAEVTA